MHPIDSSTARRRDILSGEAKFTIKLPGLKEVKWRMSRPIPDGFIPKQARIVRKASGYFVMLSLQLNVDVPRSMPHGHPRGLDLGYDKFVATSDGEEILRPRFLKTLQRELKLLQRRLKNKQKGSNNRHKLNQKIARLHQRISDTRKDWHFKLAHHLCDGAGMLFVEDINFVSWQRGMLSKHSADAGFGQFVNILEWVCFRRDVYFAKVNKDGTSQTCPNCGAHTGKKTLDIRIHSCHECGYTTTRDVAASQEIRNRGLKAVGQIVSENVCELDVTGSIGNGILVGTGRSRKSKSQGLELIGLYLMEERQSLEQEEQKQILKLPNNSLLIMPIESDLKLKQHFIRYLLPDKM
jgi:putative transposase